MCDHCNQNKTTWIETRTLNGGFGRIYDAKAPESQEVLVKFTPDEYARLEAARSGSGMQDTKTGFVKRAAMSAVELLED